MNACPPVERLSALVRGELDEADGSAIEDHLESCTSCRDRMYTLSEWALSGAAAAMLPQEDAQRISQGRPDALASLAPSPEDDVSHSSDWNGPVGHVRQGLPLELTGFRMIREVGRGGMGTVYRAKQSGLERFVALKVLSLGRMAGAGAVERFRREVQALARLDHPNVVRIHDVGEHEGVPFLVMEWVEGGDLTHRLRDGPLPVREAAEIALPLARAVQAVHDRGIIHRDLKPGNVLVSNEAQNVSGAPGRLTPKVGDFGLAKLIEDDDGAATQSGSTVGTPGYLAPEQTGLVRGVPQGPATDIYGLGAILYEMLVGRPPFGGGSRAETIRQVITGDIVPPRRLRPAVPRDIETICLKCLERDPGRRYATAGALAEELERFLQGRPIVARRAPAWEHALRWSRRKPGEARLALALIVLVFVGFATVTWLWRRASLAAEAESRLRSQAQSEVATNALDKGIALANAGDIDHGLLWMAHALRATPDGYHPLAELARANLAAWTETTIPLRTILEHATNVSKALYCDQGRAILTGSLDGTARFWDAATGRLLRPSIQHGDQVLWVAISPDGQRFATAGSDRKARLWDVDTGQPIGQPMHHSERCAWVAFSPDSRLLATRDAAWVCQLWDATTGRSVGGPTDGGLIRDLQFAPDGRSFVTGGEDGVMRSWRTTDRRPDGPEIRSNFPIRQVLLGAGIRRIAMMHSDGSVRVWDPALGRSVGQPILDARPVAFSPDGRFLFTADERGRGRLWDPVAGRPTGLVFPHPPWIRSAIFSPDGRLVLTAGEDHTARLWDVATGRRIGHSPRHRLPITNVEFAPDGRSFLTSSEDGTVKVWDLESLAPHPVGPEPVITEADPKPVPPSLAWGTTFEHAFLGLDRSRVLLSSENQGLLRMVEAADGQPIGPPLLHAWPRTGWVAISPFGDSIATSCFDQSKSTGASTASTCQIFNAANGRPTTPLLPHMNWPARLAFSPDGKILATGDFDHYVHLWDAATGRRIGVPMPAGAIIQGLTFSPDGKLLAAGTAEIVHQVVLWELATQRPRGEPVQFRDWVHRLAFSPDGSRLAAGSRESTARLIDTATGRAIGEPLRHAAGISSLGFSPDGATLVVVTYGAPEKSVVRSWSAIDGRPGPGSITLPSSIAADLALAPDGTLFAAGCVDGLVSIWHVASMKQAGPIRALRGPITALAFSREGGTLFASDSRGHLATWPVPRRSPQPADRLARRASATTGVELDPAGEVAVLDPEAWRRLRSEQNEAGRSIEPSRTLGWHESCARDAEAAGNGFAARWHLDRLIAATPGDGLLHARRAVTRLREGSEAAARADLDRALELGPRERVVDWLAHRAGDLRVSGDARGALRLIDRALAARPDDWRLHALLAEALGALGRHAERDAALARAIDLGAEIPVLMRFGEERARAGRYHESFLLFDRAIARGEVPYEVWEWAALTHLAAGDEEGYRHLCALIRSRYPASLPLRQAAWELAHVCTLGPGGIGDDGKAAAWATGSARHTGAVAYRSARYSEAIAAISKRIADGDGQVSSTEAAFLAMALFRSGDRAGALAMLARCPRPRDPAAGMRNRQQQSADQLRREAGGLIFGEPLPEKVFAP